MKNQRVVFFAAVVALGVLFARPAESASLQPVSNWGASGVPSYISMYIYVPDKVATNPPILVVSHYCGGSASGVFGEAQGGGIVAASDQYGFIMIYPQTTNPATSSKCWDVGSKASLTHDGGGDTQAIAQMVKHTISTYKANPDRVYATGTSSGAMMTEALLAVYPDVFKAGAEFSGVPAGCWSAGWSAASNWGGTCAGGNDTMTAQQWGDLVRGMYQGYSGYRPRIQLWHGTADSIINYTNHTEAIKEWTNVLGLSATPNSTTTVTLASHQWTRESWQNACGFTVLDAWAEKDGPHGTDANLNAQYVIPFLGLDKAAAVDPEIAACGTDAGAGGSDGGSGTGGAKGTGGTSGAGGMSGNGGSGDAGATGGVKGSGGTAGATGNGGSAGGATGAGGAMATGGSNAGGSNASGGHSSGGVVAAGGSNASGGAVGGSTGSTGFGGAIGNGGTAASGTSGTNGCSCTIGSAGATESHRSYITSLTAIMAALGFARRRRRR